MNALPPLPVLDPRTPDQVADEVRRHLGWPDTPRDDLREALIAVFARFAERLGQRLNTAPQRQLDAFADLLRPTPFPAQPASTVLVFKPVARATAQRPVNVPAGTQVAGPPPPGASEPIVFETQAHLVLSSAEIATAFTATAQAWTPWTVVEGASTRPADPLRTQPLTEVLAFAVPEAVVTPMPAELLLELVIEPGDGVPAGVEWFVVNGHGEQPVQPVLDGTSDLRRNGELAFRDLPLGPPSQWHGRSGRWLCLRPGGAVVKQARFSSRHELAAHTPEAGYGGAAPLDLSRDFLPLGPRPQFGDVFMLRDAAFALPGAQVTLTLTLTNPSEGSEATPVPRVATDHAPALQWDVWTQRGWTPLGPLRDGTRGFSRSGSLQFDLPADAAPMNTQGVPSGAVRARLSQGDYALDAKPSSTREAAPWLPPAHYPPYIAQASVAATARSVASAPEAVLLQRGLENLALAVTAQGDVARPVPADPRAALYLGLRWPPDSPRPAGPLQFVLEREASVLPALPEDSGAATADAPAWEYATAQGWLPASVAPLPCDLPERLALRVQAGADWQRWTTSRVDPSLLWLRLRGPLDGQAAPRLAGVRLNAVPASEQLTLADEVLGSSDGAPGQQFELARGSVLGEPGLEVGEPGPLAEPDLRELLAAGRAPRIEPAHGRLPEVAWVRWQAVPDFSAAGPQSRVYVLDWEHGRVRFGNGRQGRIPPPGPNNVRVARYRSGGGQKGNSPPGTLQLLRSSLRGVESVSQPEPAVGGLDGESAASTTAAATAWLRHRDRAVGPDDYEDLARRATPAVARARCLPARDLAADGLARQPSPGCVSIAVLPREDEPLGPAPSAALLTQVRSFLRSRCAPGTRLVLAAPLFVAVDVELEVLGSPPADTAALADACQGRLRRYLHPVTGGANGEGWDFGRWPHVSELRAALTDVAGLVEVRRLQRRLVEPHPGALAAPHALPRAGRCRITVVG